jgi:hypothetical protein
MSSSAKSSNAKRNRTQVAAIIFVATAVILVVPAASAYGEWQHALRYGWPGPYPDSISESNAGETIWKAEAWGILSLIFLAGASICAGFAARSAGQRVWLVVILGLAVCVVALLAVAFLLTPPLASSA